MTDPGRPIQASGLAKTEAGDRRVDADDLVALALALDATPNRLLLSGVPEPVPLTPKRSLTFPEAWAWASGEHLPGETPEKLADGTGVVTVRLLQFLQNNNTEALARHEQPRFLRQRNAARDVMRRMGVTELEVTHDEHEHGEDDDDV